MPRYTDTHIYCNMHDFKTNLSRYLRELQSGRYKAVVLQRYGKEVAVLVANQIAQAKAAPPSLADMAQMLGGAMQKGGQGTAVEYSQAADLEGAD